MIEVEKDWRKYAAQTYSDQEVEKAFLDQAYMFIQNKATPLMKPPHRLGFEIVFKNDANSKMVGIFAFKVGDELLYAPVFFINGSVAGTDLLYRHRSKNFVPLTTDWAEYLLGLQESEVGEGLSKENAEPHSDGINMQRLIYPPNYSGDRKKHASYSEFVSLNEGLPAALTIYKDIEEKIIKDAADEVIAKKERCILSKSASVLKKFILEDGGYNSIDKLVQAMEKDASFAEAMTLMVGAENFLPVELNNEAKEQVIKSAAVKDKGVTLHIGAFNDGIKEASDSLYKKGYQIEDNRDDDSIVTKVYADDGKEFTGVTEPGVHELLGKDGDSVRCLVAPCNHRDLTFNIDREWLDDRDSYDAPEETRLVAIDLDSGKTKTTESKNLVVVNQEKKVKNEEGSDQYHSGSDADLDKLSDAPSAGKQRTLRW